MLPIIHPQSPCHHIISSYFSRLLPVTSYTSTISTSSYNLSPVLSASSCYRLSIHNGYIIISFHPSSFSCFLLPIIHPQSLRHNVISSQFPGLLSVTHFPSTMATSPYHLIPVPSLASCYLSFTHNLNVKMSSHSSSLGFFLLPICHPQSLRHHIISSRFPTLIPVTYNPSTISTSSYRLIQVLPAASFYRLSIHNLFVIIPAHPSSLNCYLLPIIHPQSQRHHILSSKLSQLIPSCYRLSNHNLYIIISSHHNSLSLFLLPIIHPQSLRQHIISSQICWLNPVTYYPSSISPSSYNLIPVLLAESCYLLSIHNL